MRRWSMRFCFLCLAATACTGGGSEARDESLEELYQPTQETHTEIRPLEAALRKHDFAALAQLSNRLIEKKLSDYANPQDYYWLTALAHTYRARAYENDLAGSPELYREIRRAADLGNSDSIAEYLNALLAVDEKTSSLPGLVSSVPDIVQYLRAGAALGESDDAALLGSGTYSYGIPDSERLYWQLIGAVRNRRYDQGSRAASLDRIVLEHRIERVGAAVRQHSLVEAFVPADATGVPARGLAATLFADSNLRGTHERAFSWRSPAGGSSPPPAIDVEDHFRLISEQVNAVAVDTSAYLLVARQGKHPNPFILSIPRPDLGRNMLAGDQLVVRCGVLTHVATVFRIDRARGKILFADATAEYWQPSHNSCVGSFRRVEGYGHRFLAQLDLEEVEPTIQAILTFRDAPPTHIVKREQPGPSVPTVSGPKEALNSLLIEATREGRAADARALVSAGAEIDAKDPRPPRESGLMQGGTPLMYAAQLGDREFANWLISRDADVNAAGRYGDTPLAAAVWSRNRALVLDLLSRGARVQGAAEYEPILIAAGRGDLEMVQLLVSRGARVNTTGRVSWIGRRCTPLTLAAREAPLGVVRWLVAQGADVNARPDFGSDHPSYTPLGSALAGELTETVAFLISKGANVNQRSYDFNAGDNVTPLELAVSTRNLEAMHLLIKAGVDTVSLSEGMNRARRNWNGVLPIDAEIIRVLEEAAASLH